jgi:heme exporter protein A
VIAALHIESLSLERGGRRLFDRFDLDLKAGEAIALTGANGAGKTSLLRAVAGLILPTAGTVRFEGAAGPLEADDARSGGLHLMGHHDGLKTTRTAGEELGFWAAWMGQGEGGVSRAIEAFELTPLLDLEVRRLSAGQRRRLALARLIASPRPLWLLDEPLAPLDAARRTRFGKLMAAHLAGGGLILAAVHDPLPIAARAVVIGGGA